MALIDQLLADPEKEALPEEQLGVLGDAANRLVAKQKEIADAEAALSKLKEEERKINQEEIPQLMDSIGLAKITLKDGRSIMVDDSVQVAIPASIRDKAYSWMDKNGHGDLIKVQIVEKFGRGEKAQASAVFTQLKKMGLNPELSEAVHPQSLKAWAREELRQGRSLPENLFKVHIVRITKVK